MRNHLFFRSGSWFHHLKFYEVSYIWFSAISCMWAFVVGAVVSFLTGPQDPKKLNPKLISPGFLGLFSIWPRPVRDFLEGLEIGRDYVRIVTKNTKALKYVQESAS